MWIGESGERGSTQRVGAGVRVPAVSARWSRLAWICCNCFAAAAACAGLRRFGAILYRTSFKGWHAVHLSVTHWAIARALQESMRSEGRRFHAGSAGDAWQVVRRGDHGARAESGGIGGRARAAAIPRGEGGGRGPVGRGERRRGAPEAARRSPRRGRTCDEPPFVGPNSAGHECHTLHPLLP
jgi:hypothetical protein